MKRDALPMGGEVRVAAPANAATGWRLALPVLAVALIVEIACYWATAAEMVSIWARSTTFAHGFAVFPIAAWLIWRKRDVLRSLAPAPAPIVLPLMALMGFVWLAGDFASVNAVSQAAFVALLILTVVAVLGRDVTRAILFPLGFVMFAVPIGDFLLPVLMDRTADFTVAALRGTGVPVYREGLLIVVPNGRWSIVEACSGVRYLIASLMVGTLFAYLNYRALWRRWVFVAFSIVVPIVANWVRAYLIVLLGYVSDNRLAAGVDHLIYGWVFFGVVMLLMFGIGARWHEPVEASSRAHPRRGEPLAAALDLGAKRFRSVGAAACAIALVWPLADVASEIPARSLPPLTIEAIPGWQPTNGGMLPVRAEAASAWSHGLFEHDGRVVGVAIGYYEAQNTRRKLARITTPLFANEESHWVRTVMGERSAMIGDRARRIVETYAQAPGDRMIVAWEWYWVDGTVTSSSIVAKFLTGWSRLAHHRDDSAAVLLYTRDTGDARGVETLRQFTRDAWPTIEAALRREARR